LAKDGVSARERVRECERTIMRERERERECESARVRERVT